MSPEDAQRVLQEARKERVELATATDETERALARQRDLLARLEDQLARAREHERLAWEREAMAFKAFTAALGEEEEALKRRRGERTGAT